MNPDLIIQKHGLDRQTIRNGRKIWIVECRMEIVVRSGLPSCILEREWKMTHSSCHHLRTRWEARKHLPRYVNWILFSNLLSDFAADRGVDESDLIGPVDRKFPIFVEWREELAKHARSYGFSLSEIARGIQMNEFTIQHYLNK